MDGSHQAVPQTAVPQRSTHPFGNPDGAQASPGNVMSDFIAFDAARYGSGLGMQENDLAGRVLIGPKGSGKTHYLRRLRIRALDNPSLHVDERRIDAPDTETIVRFHGIYGAHKASEAWERAWRRAVMVALANRLLLQANLRRHVEPVDLERLRAFHGNLVVERGESVSIYQELVQLVSRHATEHQLTKALCDSRWAELETLLARVIRSAPPVLFFLDSIDEWWTKAPSQWLSCQLGLFYATMRLLQDHRFGARLHLSIAIRDQVWAHVLASEHGERFRGDHHVRELHWNRDAVAHFLDCKIERLQPTDLLRPDAGDGSPIERWLGRTTIRNQQRRQVDVRNYILDHSRMLPRDIVQLGNALTSAVRAARSGNGKLMPRDIRGAVEREAGAFARNQLRQCANHLLMSSVPADQGKRRDLSAYTESGELLDSAEEIVVAFVTGIGAAEASWDVIGPALQAPLDLPCGDRLGDVLWQNGVLGYSTGNNGKKRHDVFFRQGDFGTALPEGKPRYVFHPTVACQLELDRS